ncbi:outer-membrane lipoprotein carrier protein LolA [Candidatus Endowatersipora endosymbiont of Watersipora subatra]|uniref:outer-membrane lipoprotein carrier protein LolA n=1 Tax=Candidatus Endowatersipora endosymbiont of Watersipora subatra TaxID=3077946 RepID=UPI00312C7B63
MVRLLQTLFIIILLPMWLLSNPLESSEVESDDNAKTIVKINRHFLSIPSMKGEFIQFGPDGEKTSGQFYIQRPGKMRFDYHKPSPLTIKSDGRIVGVNNRKLRTWIFFPLDKTPLRFLLKEKINPDDQSIKSIKKDGQFIKIILRNKSVFGDSKITLMFDSLSYKLCQWTLTDHQGKETTIMVFNVENNVKLSKRLFGINKITVEKNSNH